MAEQTTYECWEEIDGEGITIAFATREHIEDQRKKGLIGPTATLLFTISAATYDEACTLQHQRMGWEPYKPMEPLA